MSENKAKTVRKTRYFVDAQGNYLGGYEGPEEGNPHADAIEVSQAPVDARQKWLGTGWSKAPEVRTDPVRSRNDRIIDILLAKVGMTRDELEAELDKS